MSDDFDLDNFDEDELNKILESDDPDEIDAFLQGKAADNESEKSDADDQDNADEEQDDDNSGSPDKQDEESASSGADGDTDNSDENGKAEDGDEAKADADNADSEEKYVEAKDGKHKIPYAAHVALREERNQLRDQLREAQEKINQAESKSKTMSSALEQHGIDLSALQQGEVISDEKLAELEELDPGVAQLAKLTMSLHSKLEAVSAELQEVRNEPAVNPVMQAIERNADLSKWRTSDPERWDRAEWYDEQLKSDPAFQNKSLDERFAEAVRRTKILFGDPLEAATSHSDKPNPKREAQERDAERIAAEKVASAQQAAVPTSLSNLGKSPSTEKPLADQIAELDGDALIDAIEKLPPDKVEELIAAGVL